MKTFVINLETRPARWEAFKSDCPLLDYERFPAIDGNLIAIPGWWEASPGAWGCLCSHFAVIVKCITEEIKSVLIFEDDCIFKDGFEDRLSDFLYDLPTDWELAFLGGQHKGTGKPEKISEGVYRPHNVIRTHAYALRGQGLAIIQELLLGRGRLAGQHRDGQHLDSQLGRLVESRGIKAYCPDRWFCGQRGSESDVARTRFLNGPAVPIERPDCWWPDAVDIA